MIKKVILTPNPYRDGGFRTVQTAQRILQEAGLETRICLPFEVDKSFVLPREIRFSRLDRELTAFIGLYEKVWKQTKRKIRKDILNSKYIKGQSGKQ